MNKSRPRSRVQGEAKKRPTTAKKKPMKIEPRSISRPQTAHGPRPGQSQRPRTTRPRDVPAPPPIPSYLKKDDKPKTPRTKVVTKSLIDDPNCVALRSHFFENDDYDKYKTDELRLLMEHLREYTAFCASQRDYDEAEKSSTLYERLKSHLDSCPPNSQEPNDETLTYEELVERKRQEFMKELNDFDDITAEKRAQLEQKQREETEAFEKHWRDDMPSKYRKPSPKLLQLYEFERKLGMTGQFERAKLAKIETEKQEQHEMQQAQKLLIKDYNSAKSQFEKDQRDERTLFEDTREHWRSVILARQKVEFEAISNRANVLIQKQGSPKSQRESSLRPQSRGPQAAGNAVVYHRENLTGSNRLLPPLIPPNDDRITEMQSQEQEEQARRNKRFQEHRAQKERDADDSGSEHSPMKPHKSRLETVAVERSATFELTQAEYFKAEKNP